MSVLGKDAGASDQDDTRLTLGFDNKKSIGDKDEWRLEGLNILTGS